MSRPNVIVFFTDQQRHDTSGLHGNPLDLTPNFDRYARSGTHLYHHFTCQPVCGPARACLQTGLYATANGSWRNGIPLSQNHRTLAHYFSEAGYETAYIGKWHLASKDPVPAGERGGYEKWLGANCLEMSSDSYRCDVYDENEKTVRLPGFRVDGLTDAAIRYLDTKKDSANQKPFFLFMSFLEPHHQNHIDNYPAPEGYEERYAGKWTPPDLAALGGSSARHLPGYYGMVKRLDEALGRMMDALTSLDLRKDTIVLFTSDHACHFKTRNGEYKRSCHDSSIRVPTAIWGPGFQGGGEVRHLTSLVDLPATLLDAAGIAVPEVMQGRSILPLLRREKTAWPEEVFVQISESQVARAIRTQRWKYSVVAPDKHGWNDSASPRYQEECLYDLASDPWELENLAGLSSHRAVADECKARLIRRMKAAGEKEPLIENAPERKTEQRRAEHEPWRSW